MSSLITLLGFEESIGKPVITGISDGRTGDMYTRCGPVGVNVSVGF